MGAPEGARPDCSDGRAMSFYRRQPALGFAWIPAAVQLVGGALKSQPIEGGIMAPEPSSPVVPVLLAVGGLGLVCGLLYLVWRA